MNHIGSENEYDVQLRSMDTLGCQIVSIKVKQLHWLNQ